MELKKPPPATGKLEWNKGKLPVKTDPRVTITYDPVTMRGTLEIAKCKFADESKYICQIDDEEGHCVDFAGFSLFVKGNPRGQIGRKYKLNVVMFLLLEVDLD